MPETHSVKHIANHLIFFKNNNIIIDADDLNDLLITLTERYCYFIDLVSNQLTPDFYDHVSNNIVHECVPFLEIKEQEAALASKKNRLIDVLSLTRYRVR